MLNSGPCTPLSLPDQLNLMDKLQLFKIQGRDKLGRKVLRIVGKFFPSQFISKAATNNYLKRKVFPELGEKPFSVVYFHTDVQEMSILWSIYDLIPSDIKENLEAVYFVHPSLQVRLFLATFGRFLFSGGLYKKISYVICVDSLWDHVRMKEMEIPEFVNDHQGELEFQPTMMDCGVGNAKLYF